MSDVINRPHAPLALVQAAASGALGPGASIAMSIHAQHCSQCAARMAELDSVGGAFLESQGDVSFDVEASLAQVLDRLDAPRREPAYSAEVMAAPEVLRPAFASALERGRWAYAGPGLRTLDLEMPGAKAFAELPQMLKIEPGYGAPQHGHGAMELTLVLEGAFRDETGVYGPGDLAVAMNSLTHRPVAEPGQTCLAYAVSHAPMKFTGLLGLAQRLLTPRRQ
jgi:putative transcriptional regulator